MTDQKLDATIDAVAAKITRMAQSTGTKSGALIKAISAKVKEIEAPPSDDD